MGGVLGRLLLKGTLVLTVVKDPVILKRIKGHLVDALAYEGDEGRGTLR